nr:hypothetical protein Iba_chr12cCG12080 [Ipomoea batatas]
MPHSIAATLSSKIEEPPATLHLFLAGRGNTITTKEPRIVSSILRNVTTPDKLNATIPMNTVEPWSRRLESASRWQIAVAEAGRELAVADWWGRAGHGGRAELALDSRSVSRARRGVSRTACLTIQFGKIRLALPKTVDTLRVRDATKRIWRCWLQKTKENDALGLLLFCAALDSGSIAVGLSPHRAASE